MKTNFGCFEVGTKVQSLDKYNYFVHNGCEIIVDHLGDGHVILKTFEGAFVSTVGIYGINEIEAYELGITVKFEK